MCMQKVHILLDNWPDIQILTNVAHSAPIVARLWQADGDIIRKTRFITENPVYRSIIVVQSKNRVYRIMSPSAH